VIFKIFDPLPLVTKNHTNSYILLKGFVTNCFPPLPSPKVYFFDIPQKSSGVRSVIVLKILGKLLGK
jgi:hypothetical protein